MSAQTAGPDFEGVLLGHRLQYGPAVGQFCSCEAVGKPDPDALTSMQDFHAAHVAAELRAEVGRWLGSEGAVGVAAESISDAWLDDGHGLACEYRDRPHDVTSEASARAALAALAECVGVEEVGA